MMSAKPRKPRSTRPLPPPTITDPGLIEQSELDLGPAAAFSIVYFLIILFLSWLFYTLMMRHEAK